MTETFKHKSRIITIIVGIIVYLGSMSVAQWQSILPEKYAGLATAIVIILGFLVNQLSEEKRVSVAEQLVHEEYTDCCVVEDDL